MYTQTGAMPFFGYQQEEEPRDVLQQELTLLRVEVRAIHRMLERERREHATTRSSRAKSGPGWARGATMVAVGLLYTALIALVVTLVATSPEEPIRPLRNAMSAGLVASHQGVSATVAVAPVAPESTDPVLLALPNGAPVVVTRLAAAAIPSTLGDPFATLPGSRD